MARSNQQKEALRRALLALNVAKYSSHSGRDDCLHRIDVRVGLPAYLAPARFRRIVIWLTMQLSRRCTQQCVKRMQRLPMVSLVGGLALTMITCSFFVEKRDASRSFLVSFLVVWSPCSSLLLAILAVYAPLTGLVSTAKMLSGPVRPWSRQCGIFTGMYAEGQWCCFLVQWIL